MVQTQKVEEVVLLRFGFELLVQVFSSYGVANEIIDNTEKTEEHELVEDLIQIVTVFSSRLQGKRVNKAKKMLRELLTDDSGEEN